MRILDLRYLLIYSLSAGTCGRQHQRKSDGLFVCLVCLYSIVCLLALFVPLLKQRKLQQVKDENTTTIKSRLIKNSQEIGVGKPHIVVTRGLWLLQSDLSGRNQSRAYLLQLRPRRACRWRALHTFACTVGHNGGLRRVKRLPLGQYCKRY